MSINFPATEEAVLKRWAKIDAFQTQLKLSQGRPPYAFYDGPPFGMILLIQKNFCGADHICVYSYWYVFSSILKACDG
jgi:hypothetical protein